MREHFYHRGLMVGLATASDPPVHPLTPAIRKHNIHLLNFRSPDAETDATFSAIFYEVLTTNATQSQIVGNCMAGKLHSGDTA